MLRRATTLLVGHCATRHAFDACCSTAGLPATLLECGVQGRYARGRNVQVR